MAVASSSSSSFLAKATLLLVLIITIMSSASEAKTTTPAAAAPQLNLLGILEKGRQYRTLMRLLKETHVGEQIQSQLSNSSDGFTVFAPTDNAFSKLEPGTLNRLTPQEQAFLILYHVLPKYYSLDTFETTSNPVRTQASGNKGVYNVNITSTSSSQVNVSTGVDQTHISNKLYSDFPLAVYSVDSVLLPYDIFGPKPSPPAPALAPAPKIKPSSTSSDDHDSTTSPSAAASSGGHAHLLQLVAALLICCFCMTSTFA